MAEVTEAQLRNLALRVRQQLDAAVQALDDYDRARASAGLPPFMPAARDAVRDAAAFAANPAPSAASTSEFILRAAMVARGLAVDMQDAQRLRLIKDSNK